MARSARPRSADVPRETVYRTYVDGYPDVSDIAARVRFDAATGDIWLHDDRMVMLRSSAFAELRRQLIEEMGTDGTRKVLAQVGFQMGAADAEVAQKVREGRPETIIAAAGPQLFGMEGWGSVNPVRAEFDFETGRCEGEGTPSFAEAEMHMTKLGMSEQPVCWYSLGYACGFLSGVMNRPILLRELQCSAAGHASCRFLGLPLDQWTDAEQEIERLGLHAFKAHLRNHRRRPPPPSTTTRPRQPRPADPELSEELVGRSAGFMTAVRLLKEVARTDATVLFQGETGVGKEIFSRTLHERSARAERPFLAVNCAAVPETLIESELFGVERGAFTGATVSRPGRFERADGGTLFLDEVGALTLPAQGKLLRILQEGELERLGGTRVHKVDVRIVAATNVSLREEVRAGRFRDDLFYRLNVFPIYIPPLRGRRDDIPLLIDTCFARYAARHGKRPAGFTHAAIEALVAYEWPGNIRELENVVERAVIRVPDGEPIHVNHLFTSGERMADSIFAVDSAGQLDRSDGNDIDWRQLAEHALDDPEPLAAFEHALIDTAIARTGGNVSAAARMLSMSRGQLNYRLRKRVR